MAEGGPKILEEGGSPGLLEVVDAVEDMERESLPELLFRKHTSRQSGRREGREGRESLTSSVESIASLSPFGVVIIVEWKSEEGKFSSDIRRESKMSGKQPARA